MITGPLPDSLLELRTVLFVLAFKDQFRNAHQLLASNIC